LHEPLIRQGVDVFKTDGGDGAQVPSDAVFAAGTGERIHNLYPLYFARTISDVQLAVEPDRRSCVWIRTGTSGIQRWPCAWGGDQIADFSGGRKLIKGGQSVGLSGVSFWSHDLGGFSYNRTAEYVVRSYQWGLLSPLSRAHGGLNEPWAWGERAERIIARFLDLRYRLMPYIYSLAWQSHRTGLPMMRAMVLAFPEDPRARGRDYQYAFGPSLLVAPIYEASTREDLSSSRSVYLPEGLWYALADDTPHAGGRERVVDVPLEELPVFVRAGALIPQLPSAPQHLDGATFGRELELHAWAGGRGRFTLTEDDGQSLGYTRGEYATTELACEQAGEVFTVTIGERSGSFEGIEATRPRSWRVVVHGLEGPPATVLRNGEDAEPRDWSWDADARLLSVEAGGAGRLTIRRPETD
jgi:alpha-glucosidase (family GH31 glycosyl hydrolase)